MFGTLYVTWRRVIATERTAEAAQQTVAVAQEGQITERFTRAIEQLGSDKIAIRLGGIYALERVAQDSPDKDHRQVMQVLAAYVQENSQWDGCPGGEQSFQPIPTDIQAILAVLGRLNTEYEEPEQRLDLHSTNLQGASLMRAKLQWAMLINADLHGTDLSFANLHGVNFNGTNLQDAVLFAANLEDAYLKDANLQGTDIVNTDLSEVKGLTRLCT